MYDLCVIKLNYSNIITAFSVCLYAFLGKKQRMLPVVVNPHL